MGIVSFEFEKFGIPWRLRKTCFTPFNLLVGPSGVGKTKILKSIQAMFNLATKEEKRRPECSLTLCMEIQNRTYQWEAKSKNGSIQRESISIDKNPFIDRDTNSDYFDFDGKQLPQITESSSVINTYKKNPAIAPLYLAMKSLITCETDLAEESENNNEFDAEDIFNATVFDDDTVLIDKLWIAKEKHPDVFQETQERFIEIFPTIQEIIVEEHYYETGGRQKKYKVFKLKENNVVLPSHYISSGMRRALGILLDLALAPKGAIFLIDEIENSLGVNCLPQIVDAMLERAGEVQFIVTSHHPYVINNIPYKDWRLVRRKGSEVWVQETSEIHALQSWSAQDPFMLLINAPEFEDSIS
ncbi:MAG: ATP-binding protein [Magnetococcales bacterium]|nr:ATP-binding protein [Magnetococcales bacterium]